MPDSGRCVVGCATQLFMSASATACGTISPVPISTFVEWRTGA